MPRTSPHRTTTLPTEEAYHPCRTLSAEDRRRLLALGTDLQSVWDAPTTTARDHKELLRTLLEEVIVTVFKAQHRARLTLRWRGGSLTDIDVDLPRQKPAIVRTDEDTIAPGNSGLWKGIRERGGKSQSTAGRGVASTRLRQQHHTAAGLGAEARRQALPTKNSSPS